MKKIYTFLLVLSSLLILFSCSKSSNSQNNITASNPTVTTTAISAITSTSAVSGGTVTSAGSTAITAQGVCWGASANPTITDSHTTDSTGAGSFTSNLTGLTASTNYHVRAYATNGSGTSYGSDVAFSTSTPATITYHNDGLTLISVIINGDTLNIPAGGNGVFNGVLGSPAKGRADAAIDPSGNQVGAYLSNYIGFYFFKAISDTFNNQTNNIDIDASLYLLQLVNNTGYVVTDVEAINGTQDRTFHINYGIASDGLAHIVGYFSASYTIKFLHNDPFDYHFWTYSNIVLPDTNNQSYTVHAP